MAPDDPLPAPTSTDPAPSPSPTLIPTPETPAAIEPLDLGFTFDKLALPKDTEILPEQSAKFMEILGSPKLSHQERAQALVDLQGNILTAAAQKVAEAWTAQQATWQNEIKTDPVLGGDKLEPALGEISKLIDAHGSEELRTAMDKTGMGDNPAMIRFLHKVAGFLNEGKPLPGGGPAPTEKTPAQRIFTTMN